MGCAGSGEAIRRWGFREGGHLLVLVLVLVLWR
jgi:hypothetical protein